MTKAHVKVDRRDARVKVVTEMPGHPCFTRADRSRFETALVNMAVNARDAMGVEGALTLRQVRGRIMPQIRGHGDGPGCFLVIAPRETGGGIAEANLPPIFEPLFTTKRTRKGSGLGLSPLFGFAKQSGGDVAVNGTVGEGTTFTCTCHVRPKTGPGIPRGTIPIRWPTPSASTTLLP